MAKITQIQVRRDTEDNWTAAQTTAGATPVLAAGEIGYISSGTNAGKFKIGDGTTLWGSIKYSTDGANIVAGTVADAALTSGVSTLGTAGNLVKYGTDGLVTAGSGGVTSTGTGTFATVTATTVNGTTVNGTTANLKNIVATAATASSVPLTINSVAGATQIANLFVINSPFDYSNNIVTIDSSGNINLAFGGISAGNNTISAQTLTAGSQGLYSSGTVRHSYYSQTISTTTTQALFGNGGGSSNIHKITPTASFTVTAGPPAQGAFCALIVATSGTTSRTITFGSGFKTPTTTLVTGTVSGKYFVINYVSDGTYLIEMSRTAAI